MRTILVVDDEIAIAEALSDVLADEGHRTMTAMNGRQGLERALEAPPDLIIVDMMMPVLDGLGMIRAVREHPALKQIPVVAMSALPEPQAGAAGGYQAFLQKPFNLDRLLETVATLLASGRLP